MVEAVPLDQSTSKIVNSRFPPLKVHLCQFPELLYADFRERIKEFKGLYPHQRKAIPKTIKGQSILELVDTDQGKTEPSLAGLHWCMSQGWIGVYLVPHKRLLDEKRKKIAAFFNRPLFDEPPRERVRVITISGEEKPTKVDLQRHRQGLIIVATYEAFRAFCFAVQSRQYLPQRKCFGTVVVDECHYLQDRTRGMPLQTLLFKLKAEHDPQFCLLTATMTKKDAEWWCAQLGCELIVEPLNRQFKYREETLRLGTSGPIDYARLERRKVEKVSEVLRNYLAEQGTGLPQRILIFCHARWLAGAMVKAIWKQEWWQAYSTQGWCELIHAGLPQEDQEEIFEKFKTDAHIQILVSSPLLETGVNVKGINLLIVVDPDLYTAARLSQMCGRLRKAEEGKVGEIRFIVTEELRSEIAGKYRLSADGNWIIQFNFEDEPGVLPRVDLRRLVLELLFWHPQSERTLKQRLLQVICGSSATPKYPAYAWAITSLLNFKRLLKFLICKELVRPVGRKYALTFMGDAIVETGIDVAFAIQGLAFLKTNSERLSPALLQSPEKYLIRRESFAHAYMAFLAQHVAARLVIEIQDPKRRKARQKAIEQFMQQYAAREPGSNIEHRRKYKIDPGDEEVYRRTAIWLAVSMAALYQSYRAHCAPHPPGSHSYYDRTIAQFPAVSKPEVLISERLRRNIYHFQLPKTPRRGKQPDHRPRGTYRREARFTKPITDLLECYGTAGATIAELKAALATQNLPISNAGIHAVLHGPLHSQLYYEREQRGQSHRPSYRFYLLRYKRRSAPKIHCQECQHFRKKKIYETAQEEKTHCKVGYKCETGWTVSDPPCAQFQRRSKPNQFLIYHPQHFEPIEGDKVHCPRCHRAGTVLIPRCYRLDTTLYETMTICRHCHILLKQVRKGRYQGRLDISLDQLQERIEEENGYSYITLERNPRTLYLTQGETLFVEDPATVGIALIYLSGRGAAGPFRPRYDRYFFGEVNYIILAGGEITPADHALLQRNGIEVIPKSQEKRDTARRKTAEANALREVLHDLDDTTCFTEAAESVIAKILTNISLTHRLGQFKPLRKLPLIYRQFDQIAQIFLLWGDWNQNSATRQTRNFTNALLGREGIADNAAWELTKALLPPRFQFRARKVQRTVRGAPSLGAKARDPFNCVLNDLFYRLQGELMSALEAVGFDKYYPGSGFLHRRHRRPPTIEHHNNRTLLFDLMDFYRPLFRYYLLIAFCEQDSPLKTQLLLPGTPLTEWCSSKEFSLGKDFSSEKIGKKERIYTLTAAGQRATETLGELICAHQFPYQGELMPLRNIMRREATTFKSTILGDATAAVHRGFSLLEDPQLATFYQHLAWLLKPEPPEVGWSQAPEALPQQPKPAKPVPFTARFKNVIVVTHGDKDGFFSTLHLCIKYVHWHTPKRGKIHILPTTPEGLKKTLQLSIPKLLWTGKREHNLLILADFQLPKDPIFFRNLRYSYLDALEQRADHLEFLWFDHHPYRLSLPPAEFQQTYGITLRIDATASHTYQIIRRDMDRELQQYTQYFQSSLIQGALGLVSLFLYLVRINKYRRIPLFRKRLAEVNFTANFETYLGFFLSLISIYLGKHRKRTAPRGWIAPSCDRGRFQSVLRTLNESLAFQRQLDATDPWPFYKQLTITPTNYLQKGDDPTFLSTWSRWFKEYTARQHKRPYRTWINFFKEVLHEHPPPPLPKLLPTDPSEVLHFAKFYLTKNQVPFLVLCFHEPFMYDLILPLIKRFAKQLPLFLLCYWFTHKLSYRVLPGVNPDLTSILASLAAVGHSYAGAIPRLYYKTYRLGVYTSEVTYQQGAYGVREEEPEEAPTEDTEEEAAEEEVQEDAEDREEQEVEPFDDFIYIWGLFGLNSCLETLQQLNLPTPVREPFSPQIHDLERNVPLPQDPEFILRHYIDKYPSFRRVCDELAVQRAFKFPFSGIKMLDLPAGKVTLLYSKKAEDVNQFLHYLLYLYLSQNVFTPFLPDTYDVLFIETEGIYPQLTPLHFYQLGTPNALFQRILTLKLDYPHLRLVVLKYLLSIIQHSGARLVVLSLPFTLILEQFKVSNQPTAELNKEANWLARVLQLIAQLTGVHILVTSINLYQNTKNPYLPRIARDKLRFWIHVVQRKKTYKLVIYDRTDPDLPKTYHGSIPIPPSPNTSELMANACGLPAQIDWTFPQVPPDAILPSPPSLSREALFLEEAGEQITGESEAQWIPELEDELEPEGVKAKALIGHPRLLETIYGMRVLIWRFNRPLNQVEDLARLLTRKSQPRALDLLYEEPTGNYSIRNSSIDLTALIGPESTTKGDLIPQGQGAFFNAAKKGVLPFEIFEKFLIFLFFEVPQLHAYLRRERTDYYSPKPEDETIPLKNSFPEPEIKRFCGQLLPVFCPFPPSKPWNVATLWTSTLEDLHHHFSWVQVERITDHIITQLAHQHKYSDQDVVVAAIYKGFQTSFQEIAAEAPGPAAASTLDWTPLPHQADYLTTYSGLASISTAVHPKMPTLTIAFYKFTGWYDWKQVPEFREDMKFERDLDIFKWNDRRYAVYSDTIDLSPLEALGGSGDSTHQYFDPQKDADALKFEDFLKEIATFDYIDYPQYIAFLGRITDSVLQQRYPEEPALSGLTEDGSKSLQEMAFKVLCRFPPLQPATVKSRWTAFLRELQRYFTREQIEEMVTSMILTSAKEMHTVDKEELQKILEDALEKFR